MRTRLTFLLLTGACIALSAFTSLAPRVGEGVSGTQGAGADVAIDGDDIGGVVSGPKGPEAGVWVIAETTDLPTKFSRTVVTDDRGRYLVPDLPKATYQVWVRGYGLVDSPKTTATPGTRLALKAVTAWGKNFTFVDMYLEWIKRVNEKGKGKIKIDYIGGPEVYPSFEQLEPAFSGCSRAAALCRLRHGPRLLAEESALRPREERQHSEDETGRHPQASAHLALESLDGLLTRIDRLPLVEMGGLVTLMPVAS